MTVSLWGQSTLLSTTVSASPTPTTTVFTVASITGFMQAMYIEVMVGGIYYRRQISTISGSQITLGTALPGTPDTPGSVQFKGELITNDHLNEMVNAINSNTTDIESSSSLYGKGIHGVGKLGSLTNPSATLTATDGGSGALTGTVRYRATFFNLSGETTATADPGSDLSVTAKRVTVGSIPVSGSSNCQGRGIYRSMNSGSTWHLVGRIYNNTDTTWTDNNPYTGGASVPGSNTTGNTGTLNGSWEFTDFEVASGQTLTIDDTNTNGQGGIFVVRCTGTASIVGTISGTGKFYRASSDFRMAQSIGDNPSYTYTWTTSGAHGWQSSFGNISVFSYGVTSTAVSTYCFGENAIINLNKQGMGGPNYTSTYSSVAKAGATFILIAYGAIVSSGTINCLGENGISPGSNQGGYGGAAGGSIGFISATSISHTGTRNVSGGNGSNATGSGGGGFTTGGGGGGGGLIWDEAPIIVDTGTNTVSGGSNGTNASIASGFWVGGSGGGNAGRGGTSGSGAVGSTDGYALKFRNGFKFLQNF